MIATQDADALLALDADCICYTANSDLRPDGVVDDICRMLAAGKNVVNTSYVPLLFPKAAGDGRATTGSRPPASEGGTQLLHLAASTRASATPASPSTPWPCARRCARSG